MLGFYTLGLRWARVIDMARSDDTTSQFSIWIFNMVLSQTYPLRGKVIACSLKLRQVNDSTMLSRITQRRRSMLEVLAESTLGLSKLGLTELLELRLLLARCSLGSTG